MDYTWLTPKTSRYLSDRGVQKKPSFSGERLVSRAAARHAFKCMIAVIFFQHEGNILRIFFIKVLNLILKLTSSQSWFFLILGRRSCGRIFVTRHFLQAKKYIQANIQDKEFCFTIFWWKIKIFLNR